MPRIGKKRVAHLALEALVAGRRPPRGEQAVAEHLGRVKVVGLRVHIDDLGSPDQVGGATAANQCEGGYDADGKGLGVPDVMTGGTSTSRAA